MIVVDPIAITAEKLVSNVAVDEIAWVPGTFVYDENAPIRRYEGTDLYELAGTTSDQPSVGAAKNPPTWFLVGKINRYSMFDFAIGRSTSAEELIEVTITPGAVVNALALFEIVGGASVEVEVDDPAEGVLYERTISLVDNSAINSVYDYFFAPIVMAQQAVLLDLPNLPAAEITLRIAGPASVSVGETVLGRQQQIGETARDPTIGIETNSRPERDQFGTIRVIERRYARILNATVYIDADRQDAVFRFLAGLRARAAFYLGGEEFPETHVLGFFRDFTILRTGPDTAEARIEVQGIV